MLIYQFYHSTFSCDLQYRKSSHHYSDCSFSIIEKIHPHIFRHTFVSILLSNPNIGVATVAAEAGHAQPSTTLAIYTQVYDKRRKEIRSQMSKELYE
ncbi:tyrosine-type recombinase/integrase [Faecalibacterium sp. Marseille-Q3530]|uniref:tyrosine-type recombinase/integrase n=1 Tax=Faecalibacterium sp. Marseille-Q3530 TaxID=2758403 RepID=UPI00351C4D28